MGLFQECEAIGQRSVECNKVIKKKPGAQAHKGVAIIREFPVPFNVKGSLEIAAFGIRDDPFIYRKIIYAIGFCR